MENQPVGPEPGQVEDEVALSGAERAAQIMAKLRANQALLAQDDAEFYAARPDLQRPNESDLTLDTQAGMLYEQLPDGSRRDRGQVARQVWN